MQLIRNIGMVLQHSFRGFMEDKTQRMGAALAYYTLFSIAPLIVLVITLAGLIFGQDAIRSEIFGHLQGLLGDQAAAALQEMIQKAGHPQHGLIAGAIAAGTLLLGATGVFVQLQDALNSIWHVQARPHRGFWLFIRKRILSFAMILGVGFLLMVSLVLSAGVSGLAKYVGTFFPGLEFLWEGVNFGISFILIAALFALMFKYLPDVELSWKDVFFGAVITAFLFNAGKFLLGLYFGRSRMFSSFGAAGGLVLLMVWVYYSSQIVFFGAELIKAFVLDFRHGIIPERHARLVGEPKRA